jgi:predicted nucleic acid-binding Zn ribbon protein
MSTVTALFTLVITSVTFSARSPMATPYRLRSRPCAVCGTEFRPWRGDARYCSNACRQKAYRRRVKAT